MHFQLDAVLARQLATSGLSYQDYVVLTSLADRAEAEVRVVELARNLGWEKSRMSHHLTRMEQREMIRRKKCATDQRGWHVTITATGRDMLVLAAPGHVAVVRAHFIDLLTTDELATLDTIARKVLAHLPTD